MSLKPVDWIVSHSFVSKAGELHKMVPLKYSLIGSLFVGIIAGNQLAEVIFHFSFIRLLIAFASIGLFFIWILSPIKMYRSLTPRSFE